MDSANLWHKPLFFGGGGGVRILKILGRTCLYFDFHYNMIKKVLYLIFPDFILVSEASGIPSRENSAFSVNRIPHKSCFVFICSE